MSQKIKDAANSVLGQIGRVVVTDIPAISPLWAQRFAVACEESDPVYFDEAVARSAGWSTTPLPPLLLTATRSWEPGPSESDLAEDGTPLHDIGYPEGGNFRALGGGQRLEWFADTEVNEPFTCESEVVSVSTKAGKSGEFLVVEIERRFYNSDGELVLRCGESRLLR